MKRNILYIIIINFSMSLFAHADIEINSPGGGKVIFTQSKHGENVDPNAWSKLFFFKNEKKIDLSNPDRYYTEDGSSRLSPGGNYLNINSVSAGVLELGGGIKQYVSKAYCSIVDMRNGCIISDWDGEACGYQWAKNKDVLISPGDSNNKTFDFLSMKPSVNEINNHFTSLSIDEVENLMRCDIVSEDNVNLYQELSQKNKEVRKIVSRNILRYISELNSVTSISSDKSFLYPHPNDTEKTKAYLVSGDKIKIIRLSPDKQWAEIGYINSKNNPLIAWVKMDTVK